MQLDLKVVNEILSKAYNISHGYDIGKYTGIPTDWKLVGDTKDEYWARESQGDEGKCELIFKVPKLDESLFLKVILFTDSYGGESNRKEIQFVEGKLKQISVYEPI